MLSPFDFLLQNAIAITIECFLYYTSVVQLTISIIVYIAKS